MSQRALLGSHTGKVIGVVRQHGTRVECFGLEPWLVPQMLGWLSDYWTNGETTSVLYKPQNIVLESVGS
jgi:hypothetical protein